MQVMQVSLGALTLVTLAACGGGLEKADRVPFDPKPGPPSCSGSNAPSADLAARWPDYQAKVAAFGNLLGSPKPDAPIVVETLRMNVRKLANANGCHIEMKGSDWASYDIGCANLAPADESARQKLVGAVRAHVPKILEAAAPFDSCTMSAPTFFKREIDAASKGGAGTGEYLEASNTGGDASKLKTSAGCDFGNPEACDKACEKGDADACRTFGLAKMSAEQPAAAAHFKRSCELAMETKNTELLKGAVCSLAINELVKSDGKSAFELADKVCAAAPADAGCVVHVFDAKDPIYSKKRAEAAFAAIDACTGDACDKSMLFSFTSPAYQKERANKALPWLVAKCEAKDDSCGWLARSMFDPKAPHLEPVATKKILKVIEDGCQTPFGKVPKEILCNNAVRAHMQGGVAPDLKKAFSLAEQQCDSADRRCAALAECYEAGTCGQPKDPAKAHDAWAKDCEGSLAALDASIREQVRPSFASCKK